MVVSEVEDRFRTAHPDVYAELAEPIDDSATVAWADIRGNGWAPFAELVVPIS